MKKNRIILSLFLFCFLNITYSQNSKEIFRNDVLDFFINQKEILQSDKQKFMKNFDELTNIFELSNLSDLNLNTKGVFKVSLNVTHTNSILVIVNNSNYSLHSFNDTDKIVKGIIALVKNDKQFNKESIIGYFEAISRIKEGQKASNSYNNPFSADN